MFHKIKTFTELGKRTEAMLEKIAEGLIFYNHREWVEKKYGVPEIPPPKEAVLVEGYLLPEFEKLKRDPQLQDKFLEALAEAHRVRTWPKEQLKEYLKLAIEAAEEVSRYLGREGKMYIPPEEFEKFEKLNKFLDTLFTKEFYVRKKPQKPPAEISGRKATPKFKQVQKEVESKKEMPEVEVIAPRLATVKCFEDALNAMDHEVYRNLGGVPAEYVKKVRNMALAKKLAAEHIFSVWAKEGIRPVLLSEALKEHKELIERYAKDIYEDTKRLAKAHSDGTIAGESLMNIITAERDLADKIYEITGKLLSDPSALKEIPEEHRGALKVLTGNDPGKYMVKMDRLKEYREVIRMHMEKTRPVIVEKK